jgi:hypothetical protein
MRFSSIFEAAQKRARVHAAHPEQTITEVAARHELELAAAAEREIRRLRSAA